VKQLEAAAALHSDLYDGTNPEKGGSMCWELWPYVKAWMRTSTASKNRGHPRPSEAFGSRDLRLGVRRRD
jgi:hypothetical protein